MASTSTANPSAEGGIQWISGDDVRRLLTWDALIREVRESLAAFSRGSDHPKGAVQPLRSRVDVNDKGMMLVMPGFVKEQEALATKMVSVFPSNASKGLSSHSAIILLMDAATGIPAAVLDGEVITEMRTAAASAVATEELVEKKSGLVIAILGAGTQGRSHARVMAHIFKNCKIRIWSRNIDSAQSLVDVLTSDGLTVQAAATVEAAVKDADIINTCTMAKTPILKDEWVRPGAHINSVGAPRPDWQEIEEELVRAATVYADSREAALHEAGDIIKSHASVYAEIGEIILGSKPVKKGNTTIFKSLGLAVEDAVSARLVYNLFLQEKNV